MGAILCAMIIGSCTVMIGQGVASATEGAGVTTLDKRDCRSSPARLCVWDGRDFTGVRYDYGGSWAGCVDVASSWNDRISSIYNRRPYTVVLYRNTRCSGASTTIRAGYAGNLIYDDEVTSIYFDSGR
jgi:hypothetical protein